MTKSMVASAGKDIISFDDEKLKIIKNAIAKDLTDLEFQLFISVSKARGLDPVLNQIHPVKRRDGDSGDKRMTIQVGIDGFRLIASRTGCYAGKDRAKFTYRKQEDAYPLEVEVTVYKLLQGNRVPFTATARWSEYFPGDKMGFMWKKMPQTMLEKCAEAKALRMAFPADLSGIYIPEEMNDAPVVNHEPKPEEAPLVLIEDSTKNEKLVSAFAKYGVSRMDISRKYSKEISALTDEEIEELKDIGKQLKSGSIKKADFFPQNLAPGVEHENG